MQTILRAVKEQHLFTQGKADKREVLTRILRAVGELIVHTRPLVTRVEASVDRVMQWARAQLMAMHEVIKPLMGQIVHWVTTGVEGVREVGMQPKWQRPWSVAEGVRD